MKKLVVLCLAICQVTVLFAQDGELDSKQKELEKLQQDLKVTQEAITKVESEITALKPPVYWKKGGFSALNFNTIGFNNWAAGGVQSNSVTALGNLYANYRKDKMEWVNNLDLAYGLIQNEGEDLRKNEDKIVYLTKVGYHATERLSYAVLGEFKSQFADGYDFGNPDEDRPVISKFLAPAFVQLSLGLDYKVSEALHIYASPAAGKFTIVMDDSIAAQNIYIPSVEDAQGFQFYKDNFRAEFGANINILYNQDLTKNFNVNSKLDLFNNYTDKNAANRANIDVNWETMLNMKITKFIGVNIFTHLIYDNDIEVPTEYDVNNVAIAFGPRVQFKRVLGVGFSYKF
ncbi:MAG: DUF3078 domain-containing protein [Bacteroidia bacterium]